MPTLKILSSNGETTTLEVSDGELLIDACEDQDTPILFGCRDADCGSCLVEVVQGQEHLNQRTDKETDLLEAMDARDSERLACQCRLSGSVTLRADD